MTFPLVFISSTLEIVSGEKKTFTSNFAQSAENNADPVFIKSDIYIYSYFEKGCRKKKTSKVHATRPKGGLGIHWNFAYWPRGNLQVCIFARGGFVFPLRGLYL